MTTLKDFVNAITEGNLVEPFWVEEEAHERDEMNGRYREVIDYFAKFPSVQMRPRLLLEPCTNDECPGNETDDEGNVTRVAMVRAIESRVPGAFRVDACCQVCGGTQTHRAGWFNQKARDTYRAEVGSKETG